ncbi:MAG: caspase family protein [Bacteroidota bacterium]|nr:caspase family protein [Bacteroidota bacterium]
MAQEPKIIEYFEGPVSALVIGISEYKHGVKEENEKSVELDDEQFPDLKYAADDAQEFADFLSQKGVTDVNLLVNEEATYATIKDGFFTLKKYCAKTKEYYENNGLDVIDPLVIIFFSGHGWADEDDNHYLINYEAQRHKLASTATPNKEINNHLEEIDTKKLVVFLDACHSGAVAKKQGKGNSSPYNYKKDLDHLGEGEGRYIIASCKPGQKSWESSQLKSGIFTHHLLELLKCDNEEISNEIPVEKIDILTLYKALRPRVMNTCLAEDKARQEPDINIEGGTELVIAINEKRIKERLQKEDENRQDKIEFLGLITKKIDDDYQKHRRCIYMQRRLEDYTSGVDKEKGLDKFYRCYDEYLGQWFEGNKNNEVIHQCCKDLIKYVEQWDEIQKRSAEALANVRGAPAPSKPSESLIITTASPVSIAPDKDPTQVDDTLKNSDDKVLDNKFNYFEKPQAPVTQKFSLDEHIEYILQPVMKFRFRVESSELGDCLSKPVSESEFVLCIEQMKATKKDEAFNAILDEVLNKFKERWQQVSEAKTKEVETITASTISNIRQWKNDK